MFHRKRVNPDDLTADGIKSHLVVTHNNQFHIERQRRQHPAFAGNDGIGGDELRLDDVLEVGHFLIQMGIVVNQPVPVVL